MAKNRKSDYLDGLQNVSAKLVNQHGGMDTLKYKT